MDNRITLRVTPRTPKSPHFGKTGRLFDKTGRLAKLKAPPVLKIIQFKTDTPPYLFGFNLALGGEASRRSTSSLKSGSKFNSCS